jgi:glycosyltransferase involved in cell wall biosynthesis
MKNRFSVILATYNRYEYLRLAIDSVLSQTFKDYEIIVVDDGSTDGTMEKLKSQYGMRIHAVRQLNQGPERAYGLGASFANGEYLAFLDSDDFFLPHTLATYDKIIRALNSPPVILGSMFYLWEGQNALPIASDVDAIEVLKYRDFLSKDVRIGLSQSRIVLQKSVFEEVARAQGDTSRPYIMNDYRLMLLLGSYGPCVITKRPITVVFRQHEAQMTKKVEKIVEGVLELIRGVRGGPDSQGLSGQFIRYAYLGGPVLEWSEKAFRSHRTGIAFRLVMHGWPMLAAATIRKIWVRFHPTAARLILPHDKP